MFQQALTLHREGKFDAAARGYEAVIAADPKHVDALVHLGVLRLAQGHPKEALALLRRAVSHAPQSALAHGNLGVVLQALGQTLEAVNSYRLAVSLEPEMLDAYLGLASALQVLGQNDEAVSCLQTALAFDPGHAEANYSLAVALHRLKRDDEAIARFRAALAADAEFAEASYGLGMILLGRRQYQNAVTLFQEALAVDANYIEARYGLAVALRGLESHGPAMDAYRAVLGMEPDHIGALYGLATLLAGMSRYAEAKTLFHHVLTINPEHAEAQCGLGGVLRKLGEYGGAEEAFGRALALQPNFAEASSGLGQILLENGNIEAGRAVLNAAMALAPDNLPVLYTLALAGKIQRGDPVHANLQALQGRELSLPPAAREEFHFALAKAYDDIGEHEHGFGHLVQGNAIRRRRVHYDEAGTLAFLDRMKHDFSAYLFQTKRGAGDPSPVPVFVLGMPRSGSTLIERILASHPKVYSAGECMDLPRIVDRLSPRLGDLSLWWNSGADVLPELMREIGTAYVTSLRSAAPEAERIVDKLPSNFRFAGLIHLALPNARIIHSLRDPVDTCLSCYSQLFAEGTQEFTYDLGELGRFYRAYAALMAHWRAVLPPGVMLDVEYESLVRDFETEARRIVAHCGLEWDAGCLAFHQSRQPVRTASVVQVRQEIYQSSVGRWRPDPEFLQPLIAGLAGH